MIRLLRELKRDMFMLTIFGIALIGYLLFRSHNISITYRKLPTDQDNTVRTTIRDEDKNDNAYAKNNTECDIVTFSENSFNTDGWQRVDNVIDMAYVYSAYMSWADDSEVVVVGALRRDVPVEKESLLVISQSNDYVPFYCVYWYLGHLTNSVFEAELLINPLVEKQKHRVVFFRCPLAVSSRINLPQAVSLVFSTKCITPRNYLSLELVRNTNKNRNFTVCIPPDNLQMDKQMPLVEWVELNKLLGAELFVFYRNSISQTINDVLELYSDRGWAEVIDWNLENVTFEIDQNGRVAAMNDCYRRYKHQSTYIVFLDTNEYIVPKNMETLSWQDMMLEIPSIRKGVFVFHVSYFRTDWSDPASIENVTNLANAKNYGLQTLLKLHREDEILPPMLEARFIVHSHRVKALGTRDVLMMHPDYAKTLVHPSKALVHKYSPANMHDLERIQDASVPLKYGDKLVERVRESWKVLSRFKTIKA